MQLNTLPWSDNPPCAGQLVRDKRTGETDIITFGYDDASAVIDGYIIPLESLRAWYDLLLPPCESPEQGYAALCAMFGVSPSIWAQEIRAAPGLDILIFNNKAANQPEISLCPAADAEAVYAGDGTPPELEPLRQLVDTIAHQWRGGAAHE